DMRSLRFVLAAAALFSVMFVLPAASWAVDGQVLLDQTKAMLGNVTAGDTPGFPITINAAGSYKLDGNLTVSDANTTAIVINHDDVTIDLNGFSIIGPNVCTSSICTLSGNGVGITTGVSLASSVRDITISNGTIRGMGSSGISVNAGDSLTIEDMHLQ